MFEKLLENEAVQAVLIAIIGAVLTIGGKIIIAVLNELKNYIGGEIKNETLKNANQKVFDKISVFVMDCYKSGSEDLKQKIKDGKLTAEEKAEWKTNLLSYVKENSDKELKIIKDAGFEIDNTIKFYAELAFADIKKKLFKNFI
jgi:hypothetical protein